MKPININTIKDILSSIGLTASKNKGQNYLIDQNVCNNIAKLIKNPSNSKIIEVGPGLGSLTYYLEEITNNLTVIDIDSKSVEYLKSVNDKGVNIILNDALEYDYKGYDVVVSNIPYNITSKLVEHIILSAIDASQFVFMVQKEKYIHFASLNGSEYGPLSILINLLGDIKKAFDVSNKCFLPSPKCTSTVFSVDVKHEYDFNLIKETYSLAKVLFINRRKSILNNLTLIVGRDTANELLNKLNINPLSRPEEISPINYFNLNNLIRSIN